MALRIFVQVWCEVDPTLNVRVDRQSGAPIVESGDVLMRVSPLGRFGVVTALELAGSSQGSEAQNLGKTEPPPFGCYGGERFAEVVAFSLGDGHEPALHHALAAGAKRAVQINLPKGDPNSDCLACLAEWLREQKPDLVIADRIAGRLAARLGWAHLAGLDQLQIGGSQLRAIRHLGRGDCESVTAKLPAVVRLQTANPRTRYVAQARLAHAASRTIEQASLNVSATSRKDAELGPLQLSRPRTKLGSAPVAAPISGLDRLSALMGFGKVASTLTPSVSEPVNKTPDQMAEEFVRYLAHHNLLND